MKIKISMLLLIAAFTFSCSTTKKTMTAPASETASEKPDMKKKDKAPGDSKKPKSKDKSYSDIITDEAKSDDGLFKVHHVDDKYYYEVPNEHLNKDMLLVTRIAKTPANLSPFLNAGSKTNEQVIHWEKKNKNILMKSMSFNSVAADSIPIYESVKNNNLEPIISSFKIVVEATDSTGHLIDVTSLFTNDITAIGGMSAGQKRNFKVTRLDKTRSYIDTIRSYPTNIEAVHTMTFNAGSPPSNSRSGTITLQMNQSMILLPEDKMTPRLNDPRVGWFTVSQIDYASEALKSDVKTYIRKWKLVPKDKAAYMRGELVEPEKQIVYYLDPATPLKWRKYFRMGIEDWNVAFERAGFKNAIVAKDPPTKEENPDFSPEDARYSTVRYVASTTRNAVGPSVSDPRTGEILESDIIWYHNHLRSYRNRYLIETGAANPKARTLDTPEEEIGEMMRRVISHEIGHALGLPHNMKASAAYPTEKLRSGAFTQEFGIATTIMDYARFNYVAQPGDEGIRFIRQLGPYDMYAIEFGYRWYPDIDKASDENDILHKFVSAKSNDPMYMFGSGRGSDPDAQTECVGDDAVLASDYGLKNLKIVAANLVDWTTTDAEGYGDLSEIYGELLSIYRRYVGHVASNIGGVHQTLKTSDQNGMVYEPVPSDMQRKSVRWLNQHAFTTPTWLMRDDILQRISGEGVLTRLGSIQQGFLNSVLNANRMQRLVETSALNPNQSYTLNNMLEDVRRGVFSEVYSGASIDVSKRALQRAYIDRVNTLINVKPSTSGFRFGPPPVNVKNSDIYMVSKMELKTMQKDIKKAIRKQKDSMSKMHLTDCLDRIEEVLNPDKD